MQIVNVDTDYKRGLISAIETSFPEWHHSCCYFHYTQAIYRKVQELGLLQAYKNNPMVKEIFQKFMSVAFVPLDQVLNCLQDLVQASQTAFSGAPVSSSCRFSILFSTDLDGHLRS